MTRPQQALRPAEAHRIAALPDDALIGRPELAVLLGVHRHTLASYVRRGLLPPPLRFGSNGHAKYRMGDLRAMLESRG